MEKLICAFWRQYSAFKLAVTNDDFECVQKLDAELNSLIEQIINHPTNDADEIREQFRFATDLLNVEAEDVSCVKRNIGLVRKLVEKHLGMAQPSEAGATGVTAVGQSPFSVLDEDHCNELDVPIVVVRQDYKISYANRAFQKRQLDNGDDILNRHIAEIVGFGRFRTAFKAHLDNCLKGAITRFTHQEDFDGETWVKIYEMSPCFSPSQRFIGALIRLSVVPDRREARA